MSSKNDEEQNEEEHCEGLDASAYTLQEHRDENHEHFAIHDDCLPEVSAHFISIIEKPILILELLIGELLFLFC